MPGRPARPSPPESGHVRGADAAGRPVDGEHAGMTVRFEPPARFDPPVRFESPVRFDRPTDVAIIETTDLASVGVLKHGKLRS